MKIELKLKTPMTPNFIYIEMPPGQRQDGFKEGPSISISDLSNEQLEEIGNEWTRELIEKARAVKKDCDL